MPIIGHGIDLIETRRIAEVIDRHAERFLDRVFTKAEQAYALPARRRVEHLAGRFAAKEAVAKALGTGISGISWTDIEVAHRDSGQPEVRLSGAAAALAASRGVRVWHLSISHTSEYAMASAIASGD